MRIPTTLRGKIILERRILPACDGLVGLAQSFTGTDTRTLVTHAAFVLTRVEILEGRVSFPLNSGTIPAPKRFVLAIPPRSVLPMAFERAHMRSEGVAGFAPLMTATRPAMLVFEDDWTPLDLRAVQRAVCAPVVEYLDADAEVARALVQARLLLHDLIAHPAPLRTAAKRVGIRPETLCRGFGRAYNLTPKQYCHRARLFEAVLRLVSGETILEAALAAGFWDLKRFYEQFKRLLGTTPGPYARVKNRQDTSPVNRL